MTSERINKFVNWQINIFNSAFQKKNYLIAACKTSTLQV